MAIDPGYEWLYDDAIAHLAGCRTVLVVGGQVIKGSAIARYGHGRVADLFRSMGMQATEVDLCDPRSELRHDLSNPVDMGQYDAVFEIGTIEHVGDPRTAIGNVLRAIRVGGRLFMLVPVRNYFNHGFFTFSPEYVIRTLQVNGMDIDKMWYVAKSGKQVPRPVGDCNLALVATKLDETELPIRVPVQECWL